MLARLDVTPTEAKEHVRRKRLHQRRVQYNADVLHREIVAKLADDTQTHVIMMNEYVYETCAARIPWWKKLLFKLSCFGDIDEAIRSECITFVRENEKQKLAI